MCPSILTECQFNLLNWHFSFTNFDKKDGRIFEIFQKKFESRLNHFVAINYFIVNKKNQLPPVFKLPPTLAGRQKDSILLALAKF